MSASNLAPRPTSLRTLLAELYLLAFRDHKDLLFEPLFQADLSLKTPIEVTPFENRLRQLLWWPPDVFALTSIILNRTGLYRLVVGPDSDIGCDLWRQLDWQPRVEAHAEAWRSATSELLLGIPDIPGLELHDDALIPNQRLARLLQYRIHDRCGRQGVHPLSKAHRDRERRLDNRRPDLVEAPSHLIEAFIQDLCYLEDPQGPLADQNILALSAKLAGLGPEVNPDNELRRFFEAILGLHIIADAAAGSIGLPRSSTLESTVYDTLANLLLTLRGSLSTCPKFYGVVLPKMKTPQTGLTLRNLSHHLTFHRSETEVMWRSFPWLNIAENTVNILYVPYPFEVDPKSFQGENNYAESVGYFTYKPGRWKAVGSAVDLVNRVREERGVSPHFLVFTETAFDEDTYKSLLSALSRRYDREGLTSMPIVVAGLSHMEDGKLHNELRLATYFAGKWYQLTQHKHHRWQLDQGQIRRYGLQGRLSTARPLFERCSAEQRRLTFFAPAPWLVLSPLICEDLSRIEPISELVRGVGPTLVLALLFDGPQLPDRWSGRYASVLADDPGSAVLTVTSFGAARSSRAEAPFTNDPDIVIEENDELYEVVASWKSRQSAFRKLHGKDKQALLVTLTAEMGEEYSLDNRRERAKSGEFSLDGVYPLDFEETTTDTGIDPNMGIGTWSDMREVTALTYVASAALSLLRPHLSTHPNTDRRKAKTDSWEEMKNWEQRVQQLRHLIDIMIGHPVLMSPAEWTSIVIRQPPPSYDAIKRNELFGSVQRAFSDKMDDYDKNVNDKKDSKEARSELRQGLRTELGRSVSAHLKKIKKEEERPKRADEEEDYVSKLKASRQALLDTLNLKPKVQFRHLFATLNYAQSSMDLEVIDDEAIWPTDSIRFAAIALRVLTDVIAGVQTPLKHQDAEVSGAVTSNVYCRRLRIAARALRHKPVYDPIVLWSTDSSVTTTDVPVFLPEVKSADTGEDVIDAPKLTFSGPEGAVRRGPKQCPVYYLRQFPRSAPYNVDQDPLLQYADQDSSADKLLPGGTLPDLPLVHPERYDFFKMVLELVDAIRRDDTTFLMACESRFEGKIGRVEMRRLTYLILMMMPALIHEQLEYEFVRMKRAQGAALDRGVIANLIARCDEILREASKAAQGRS